MNIAAIASSHLRLKQKVYPCEIAARLPQESFSKTRKNLGKIAIYLDYLQGYGADKTLLKIANGLANRGLDIDFVLARKPNLDHLSIHPNIQVFELASGRFNPLKNVLGLTEYLCKHKPNLLFSSIHFNNVVAAFALKLANVKTQFIARQANTLEFQFKGYSFGLGRVLHPLTQLAYQRANLIISPSKGMISDLTGFMKVDEHKIEQIYNPTVTPDIFESAREKTGCDWLDRKTAPVIVAAGRLKPQKDFPTLLRAFAKLKQQVSNAKLVILGEGPQRQELENLAISLGIGDDVRLVGFQANPYAFLAKADVFALSSYYEGLPNILIEALALGKKIVATNCSSGPAEILRYGEYGRLVPVGSAIQLAEALEVALTEPFSPFGETTPAQNFDRERQVEKYIHVFLSLLEKAEVSSVENREPVTVR